MIIASISGGLGNQMFQYAMARSLANRHGVDLKLDLSKYHGGADRRPAGLHEFRRQYRLDHFRVAATEATTQEIVALRDRFFQRSIQASIAWRVRRIAPSFLWPDTHFREKCYRFDQEMFNLPPNVYVQGFWQSEKYFADVAPQIRRELSPKDPALKPYARQYVDRLRALGGPVVSLHVRRGDLAHAYGQLKNPDLVYGPPVTLDYIGGGLRSFAAPCVFLVFSDTQEDIKWCKQNINGQRLHFCEGHSDVQDLAIMSECDHHIIANSTFSWWAAWLDGKPDRRVVAPREWSAPNGPVQMVVDDLIPAGWEIL